jgi:hypothetical protein
MWDFWGYFSQYSISQILASCILVFCLWRVSAAQVANGIYLAMNDHNR